MKFPLKELITSTSLGNFPGSLDKLFLGIKGTSGEYENKKKKIVNRKPKTILNDVRNPLLKLCRQ